MSFFALKISDPNAVDLVNSIKSGSQDVVVQQLNQLESELKIGEKVFIQLGGDKVSWDKGLIGLAQITKEPFDKGYDDNNARNFRLGLKMVLVLKAVIRREEFRFYADAYDAGGIGPNTRGEQNQAIKSLTDKQAYAIIRAMVDKENSLEDKIKEIFDEKEYSKIFGTMSCLIEKNLTYDEAKKIMAQGNFDLGTNIENEENMDEDTVELKNCLDVIRTPRINKIHPINFIVYGAPGTGKTYSMIEYALAIVDNIPVDEFRTKNPYRKSNVARYKRLVKTGQVVFTTFHQNYGYEEFIQGLRPDKDSETMAFKVVDGVFKAIADRALNDTENKNYVIIIDEINRANISKVFGELITLIEEDKRWGELNETSATLQSGDPFAVPNNLYIVGTMNSADKSISLIDAALRRRFDFIEQKPDSALVPEGVLRKMFDNINENLVSELDSTDLLVGHSYFMKKTEKDLCNILNNNIIPLLYEYFYDNRKKVAKLLKDAIDKSGAQIEIVDEKVGRLRVKDKVE